MAKPFAVFDIDGTLIRWQLFHAIVHRLGTHNLLLPGAHQRIKQARMQWKTRIADDGFHDYELVLVNEYKQALKNIEPAKYQAVVQEVFDEYKDQTYTYTRHLIQRLKGQGYYLVAISGSHQEVIEKLAHHHGFDVAVGANFEQADGRFSGNFTTPIFDKAAVLQGIIHDKHLSRAGSYAVGDSQSDAPLLAMAEHPIAFNPDKKLFKIAAEQQYKIVIERKNMIYELAPEGGKYVLQTEA